jgi:hypothetical protein
MYNAWILIITLIIIQILVIVLIYNNYSILYQIENKIEHEYLY